MKRRIFSILLGGLMALSLLPVQAFAQTLELASASAILMDMETGEILYAKNMHAARYPASITKILTGLLVAESAAPHEIVTVSATANASALPRGYANIALETGEEIVLDDAMYALMLASANDMANALAEHVGGTQAQFARLMNERAGEIGALGSSFVNASGVPNKNHYTTCYDMALITREAYQNEAFRRYFCALEYTLPPTNIRDEELAIDNHHLMMFEEEEVYSPDVIGGKIGYTNQARHTMSTVATRNGRTLICVVMYSTRLGKYTDTQKLLDYGFRRTQSIFWGLNLG